MEMPCGGVRHRMQTRHAHGPSFLFDRFLKMQPPWLSFGPEQSRGRPEVGSIEASDRYDDLARDRLRLHVKQRTAIRTENVVHPFSARRYAAIASPLALFDDDILPTVAGPIGEGCTCGALAFEARAGIDTARPAADGKPQPAAGAVR